MRRGIVIAAAACLAAGAGSAAAAPAGEEFVGRASVRVTAPGAGSPNSLIPVRVRLRGFGSARVALRAQVRSEGRTTNAAPVVASGITQVTLPARLGAPGPALVRVVARAGGRSVRTDWIPVRSLRARWPRVPVGQTPIDVAAAGRWVWVLSRRAAGGTELRLIDGRTGRAAGEAVRLHGNALAADPDGVWVKGPSRLRRVDAQAGPQTSLDIRTRAWAIAAGPGRVWALSGCVSGVLCTNAGTLDEYDATTGRRVARTPVAPEGSARGPRALAAGEGHAWAVLAHAARDQADAVVEVATSGDRAARAVALGGGADVVKLRSGRGAIAAAGGAAWAVAATAGQIVRIPAGGPASRVTPFRSGVARLVVAGARDTLVALASGDRSSRAHGPVRVMALRRLDAATGRSRGGALTVGIRPRGDPRVAETLAVGAGSTWVTSPSEGTVIRVG